VTWLLAAGVCMQVNTSPVKFIAERVPAILSFTETSKPSMEVYVVRFKYGGEATFMFFDSPTNCETRQRSEQNAQ
jgi:hypothetical protein